MTEQKKYYDFMSINKGEKATVGVLEGFVVNSEKAPMHENTFGDKKVLNFSFKVQGGLVAKLDYANGEFDKSKNYEHECFVRVACWDPKKFNVLKNAKNALLEGNLRKKSYEKDGKTVEYIELSISSYNSIKILKYKTDGSVKSNDFTSQPVETFENIGSDVPF